MAWKIEDLSIRLRHGHSVPSGFHMYRGRRIGDYAYEETYQTANAGMLDPEEWKKLVTEAIHAAGEDALQEAIREHVRAHCAWLKRAQDVEEYALECHAGRSYLHWKDFSDRVQEEGLQDEQG